MAAARTSPSAGAGNVPAEYVGPIMQYAPLAEAEAHKYGLTGAQLLAKLLKGESGFRLNAVSSAGARGPAQFIPSTRQAFISRYGVDPWKSPADAVHAAALFMRDQGLAKYNPGGGRGYIDYILGQQVTLGSGAGATAEGLGDLLDPSQVIPGIGAAGLITDQLRGEAVKALLYVLLVGGGATLATYGLYRMTASTATGKEAADAATQAALLVATKGRV